MSAHPGRLIDVGGFRLHLHGAGPPHSNARTMPTVIFDAALAGTSLSWSLVAPLVAGVARAYSYDRAGLGWSDAGPMPRTAGRIATELHELLRRADVPPPYLLVGHSFGGLVARVFASRYRDETVGLVLVDPAHPDDWVMPAEKEARKIERGARLCRQGAAAARLGIARLVVALVGWGAIGAARALVTLTSRGGLRRDDEEILAPYWKLPPAARRLVTRFWTEPKFYEALGSQIESIRTSAAETIDAGRGGYGDLPLVTISSTSADPHRRRRQDELAGLSSCGRHIIAPNSSHWIPLDEPQLVADIVLEMLRALTARRESVG